MLSEFRLLFFVLTVSFVSAATAQETPVTYSDGKISSNSVLPLMGTFLLIRNKYDLCAIRFRDIWRSNDAKESTALHSGNESFRTSYEWYAAEKRSNEWTFVLGGKSGQAELLQGPMIGLGRLAFGKGNIRIRCGSIKVKWSAPAYVYFYHGVAGESGI